jgi:peptidylprolyl isomerase
MPGLKKALEGQAVGSRVLFAVPPADGFAGGNTQAGIAATDTMIFVVDILQASLDAPSGKPGTETKWADTLKLKSSAEGVSLTIPDETAPKELVIETLIEGDGAKVASSDSIVTNYVGYSWTTKSVVEPWVKDGLKNDAAAVSSTLSGLQKALVGATVGSRILVIMPPADSWPEGSIEPKVEKGDTVVYVIDILFILK